MSRTVSPQALAHRFRLLCPDVLIALAILLVLPVPVSGQPRLPGLAGEETPQLVIGETAIAIEGIPAGGEVTLLGVGRTHKQPSWTEVRYVSESLVDEDLDGRVEFDLGEEVPITSTWAAVDMSTGATAIGAPEGFKPKPIDPRFYRPSAERKDRWEIDRTRLQLLLVRPGVGAWQLLSEDGDFEESGPANDGRLDIGAERLAAVGERAPAPPTAYEAGDTFIAIDPRQLDYVLLRIAP